MMRTLAMTRMKATMRIYFIVLVVIFLVVIFLHSLFKPQLLEYYSHTYSSMYSANTFLSPCSRRTPEYYSSRYLPHTDGKSSLMEVTPSIRGSLKSFSLSGLLSILLVLRVANQNNSRLF